MQFEIHAIDRDSGNGRCVRRYAFAPMDRDTVSHLHPELPGLVTHQDIDAGHVATLEAPEGSRLDKTEAGDDVLILPGGTTLGADDAMATADASRPWHRLSLKLIP